MIEYLLIKVFLRRKEFDSYYQYVSCTNRDLQKVMYALKELHKAGKEEYTLDELELCFYGEYPALRQQEKDLFGIIFKRIKEADADPSLVENYLSKHRDSVLAHRTATLALEVYEGRKDISELYSLLTDLNIPSPIGEEIKFVTSDLQSLYDNHVAKQGLRWRLHSLNQSLGSLRKGDFGFLFARPETGKTTFLASEITYMASQLEEEDGPIVWFNNEEQGEKVMRRVYSSALGKTEREVFEDILTSQQEFDLYTKKKICIIDEATLTKDYIEKVCAQLKPSLIIFDQIDKLKGFDADRNDLLLGKIYQWARELAKTYCPVIAVCQADGQGEGIKWLTMGHVADAKTAKQAEADWILGIGKSNDDGYEYIRYLNISKNKLSGDTDSNPAMRHGRFECILKPEIARYEDIEYG